MFSWLGALKVLLTLTERVMVYVQQKQLIEAGEARHALASLRKAKTHVAQALAAKDRIDSDPEYAGRVRDRFTRNDE